MFQDNPLLAQRQRCSWRISMGTQAATLDLAACLGQQRSLFGAIEPQHGCEPATAGALVRPQSDVLDHAALTQQAHMLEGTRHPQTGKGTRWPAQHDLVHQAHLALAQAITPTITDMTNVQLAAMPSEQSTYHRRAHAVVFPRADASFKYLSIGQSYPRQ